MMMMVMRRSQPFSAVVHGIVWHLVENLSAQRISKETIFYLSFQNESSPKLSHCQLFLPSRWEVSSRLSRTVAEHLSEMGQLYMKCIFSLYFIYLEHDIWYVSFDMLWFIARVSSRLSWPVSEHLGRKKLYEISETILDIQYVASDSFQNASKMWCVVCALLMRNSPDERPNL